MARADLYPIRPGTSWDEVDLKMAKISAEVAWYCESRGIAVPTTPPRVRTPEPGEAPGAVFDPERVDRVLAAFDQLRHTKGRFANKPLKPDPWQVAYIIAPVFGWVRWDDDAGKYVRVVRTLYVDVPRKAGKGVYTEEMILTGNGWKKFGDLVEGDTVHSVDGSLVNVSYVSPVHHLDCYEVEFGDGQVVTCDSDHLWTVYERHGHNAEAYREAVESGASRSAARAVSKGAWKTIDTPTLFETFRQTTGRRDTRYTVRMDRVLQRPEADLPMDPYLLGAWLGDGSTDAARIHGVDQEILDAFRDEGYEVIHVAGCTYSVKPGFLEELRSLGVLGNKHVPEAYLLASEDQRRALLQGLMDTDGGASKGSGAPRCEFTSTLKHLAEGVLFLARSLGYKAVLKEGRSTLNGVDHGPKYRVFFNAFSDRSPFRLKRKTAILADRPEKPTRSSTNAIVDVRKVESVPTRCIQVDHPSHQFLVGRGLIPTHNTTIAGGLGLYLTAADGEYGAQVLACATTRDQARFAFDPIQTLAKSSEGMRRHLVATKYRVTHPLTGSYFQPVASVGDAQHGADLHGAIVDEVHLHKNNDLIESIETGTGSRTQPLLIFITTADAGRPNTPYANKRGRVDKLASRSLKDPTTYGVVWAADPDDDPMDPRTWAAANPGLGITPTWAFMEQAAAKAEDSPAELASFLRLHLGIRTRQTTRFIRLEDWDRNASIVTESDLVGREAYGGLDLAAVSDITALCWLFPDGRGGYDALWRLWAPADKVEELDSRTAGAASVWARSGVLTLTPGNITDYDYVEEQIKRDLAKFDVRELAFDPWNSSHLVTNLGNEGAPMVQVRQGFVSMSPPLKELQRLVLTGTAEAPKLRHGGNPAVRWMMDNLAVATDPAGNVKPDKASSAEKIDAISALVNALSRGMVATSAATSAYDDDQGLMIV